MVTGLWAGTTQSRAGGCEWKRAPAARSHFLFSFLVPGTEQSRSSHGGDTATHHPFREWNQNPKNAPRGAGRLSCNLEVNSPSWGPWCPHIGFYYLTECQPQTARSCYPSVSYCLQLAFLRLLCTWPQLPAMTVSLSSWSFDIAQKTDIRQTTTLQGQVQRSVCGKLQGCGPETCWGWVWQ